MTQTAKGQNQKGSVQRVSRPGQRQQERMMRRIRRKRRRTISIALVASVVFLVVVGVSYWQIQQLMAQHAQAQTQKQPALKVQKPACASAASAIYSAAATPSAGPTSPPQITCTPTTTSDGLQYVDITVGNGPLVSTGSSVSVQYVGWLASNGKKFDSSYDRGAQAFQVTVGQGQVIKGWDEGLVGMRQGGTRRLIIPGNLAYGPAGSPPTIPPNATLIFDITVVSVQ
jgi:FKBP-type peptidyl-prolyl cis-trans isomerase